MTVKSEAIVAVDIGTSSIRATLISLSGELLATRSTPTPTHRMRDGSAGLDAAECWELTQSAIAGVSGGARVLGIGVAAQLGLVLVDAALDAITPVMLWSDQTAQPYVAEVRDAFRASAAPTVGRRISSELAAPRLRMLLDRQPDVMERAAKVLSLKDYLTAKLTGVATTDPTHASYTLLYDVAERAWSTDFAASLELAGSLLPEVRTASEVAGFLRADVARACGLPEGIPVAVGGPDGTVGAIGAGASEHGRTVDIAGTTDVLVHVVENPLIDPESVVTTNAHVADGLWTIGGATGMTGGTLSWLAGMFGYPDVESMNRELEASLEAVPMGSNGVLVDPALTGHRFPYWDLARTGRIQGMTPGTGRADIVNATNEGAAFLVAVGLEEISRLGQDPTSVAVVGGVARREENLRLRADVWGIPVEGVSDGMATSRGVAVLAATASGLFSSLVEASAHLVPKGTTFEPDGARAAVYRDIFTTWKQTFSGLDTVSDSGHTLPLS